MKVLELFQRLGLIDGSGDQQALHEVPRTELITDASVNAFTASVHLMKVKLMLEDAPPGHPKFDPQRVAQRIEGSTGGWASRVEGRLRSPESGTRDSNSRLQPWEDDRGLRDD